MPQRTQHRIRLVTKATDVAIERMIPLSERPMLTLQLPIGIGVVAGIAFSMTALRGYPAL